MLFNHNSGSASSRSTISSSVTFEITRIAYIAFTKGSSAWRVWRKHSADHVRTWSIFNANKLTWIRHCALDRRSSLMSAPDRCLNAHAILVLLSPALNSCAILIRRWNHLQLTTLPAHSAEECRYVIYIIHKHHTFCSAHNTLSMLFITLSNKTWALQCS